MSQPRKTKTKIKKSARKARNSSALAEYVPNFNNTSYREVIFKMPRNKSIIFPDRYYCSMRTGMQTIVQMGAANTITYTFQTYKINGIAATAGPAGVGPSINGGAFSANYPSGLSALLGSSTVTGGTAIYEKYRVHASHIEVVWVPHQNAATGANLSSSQVVIFPTSDPYAAYSAMTVTQLMEQPWAKSRFYPATSTTEPKKFTHNIGTLQLLGDRFASTIEDPALSGSVAADPTQLIYWVVVITNWYPNGESYLVEGNMMTTVTHDVELYDRHLQKSVAPA